MKKLIFLFALMLSMSTIAQNYNSDQKYGFWSNWTTGANIELVDGPNSGFDGGLGLDLQFTKRLSNRWNVRLTGSAPALYKIDTMFNRYALASLGAMWFPWGEHFYIATDAGVGTLIDSKWHAYFTSTTSLGYQFIIKENHIINAELGCNYRHSTLYIDGGPDHFVRLGYAYSFGPTRIDRQIAEQRAKLAADAESSMLGYQELIKIHNDTMERLECMHLIFNDQTVVIKKLNDSIVYLNSVIDSLWMMIEDADTYVYAPTVVFECNSYTISKDQMSYVKNLANLINQNTDTVDIWGFADCNTGSDSYNLKLSEKRANAFKDALVKYGVKRERINAIGKGSDVKYCDATSAASRKAILILPVDPYSLDL